MGMTTFDAMFEHAVGDTYDAEHRFLDAMRAMREKASDPKSKKLLKEHIAQTEGQIENLKQVFVLLGKKAKRVRCAAAAGIVSEGEKGLEEAEGNPLIVDCLIAESSAKVEHYEIVSYRSLIAAAEASGQDQLLMLLEANLRQELETAARVEEATPALLRKAYKASKPARALKKSKATAD